MRRLSPGPRWVVKHNYGRGEYSNNKEKSLVKFTTNQNRIHIMDTISKLAQSQYDHPRILDTESYNHMPDKNYHSSSRDLPEESRIRDLSVQTTMSEDSDQVITEQDLKQGVSPIPTNGDKILVQSTVILQSENNVRTEKDLERSPVSPRHVFEEPPDKPPIEVICKSDLGKKHASVGIQASPSPQYRLRFLPVCGCSRDESEWNFCHVGFCLRLLGRWALSQCGLGSVLLVWALLGAAAFYGAEGPRQEEQARELRNQQRQMALQLATDLKMTGNSQLPDNTDTKWKDIVQKYVQDHEALLLAAVAEGYGEGGGGDIWSYPGCLLFAVSLLTTLGFGAPVPRTTGGRIAAVLFAAVGIPLHLLLVLNVGTLAATRLQRFAMAGSHRCSASGCLLPCCCRPGKKTTCAQQDVHPSEDHNSPKPLALSRATGPVPKWLQWLPAGAITVYYLFGVLAFGAARGQSFTACLLFPLDFTAAGGVGLTPGSVRALYAVYLEGAVILAATCVAVLQVAATHGLVNIGLKLGLLTNS